MCVCAPADEAATRPVASREEETVLPSSGPGAAAASSFSLEPLFSWLQCDPFAARGKKHGPECYKGTMAVKGLGRSRGTGNGKDASGLTDPATGLRYLQVTYKI